MSQTVRHAVIPAAGLGTRFLPASKAAPKELFPLGDRPVLHWIAAEAVAAGAQDICIVLSREKEAIRQYFSPDPGLEQYLAAKGRSDALAPWRELVAAARFHYVYQDQPLGLGHAILQARPIVGDAPFLVLLGDGPIRAATPVCQQLAAVHARVGGSVIGLRQVPEERTSAYGIVAGRELEPGLWRLDRLVEKPPRGTAPSRLAIAGRYLLSGRIFPRLERQAPGTGGEIQVTDAIAALLADEPVHGYVYEGQRFDIGHPQGYYEALSAYRNDPPDGSRP